MGAIVKPALGLISGAALALRMALRG